MNRRDFVKGSLFSGAAIAGLRAQTAAQREGVSPASRITVGVIGAGARAQQIMDAALTIPGIEIVAVSDAYWGRAQRARGRAGGFAKIHGDYREILADKGINGVLVYPDGFTVNLSSTFNNQTGETGLEILGTEGSLAFQGSQLVFRPENAYSDYRWVVDSWPKALAEAYYSDPKVLKEQSPSTWKPRMNQQTEVWDERGQEPTIPHLINFFDSVKSRKQPIEDALTGHRAAACAHMVNASLREMKPIKWDFHGEKVAG